MYEDAFQLRQKVLLKKVKRFPQILILKLLKIGCTLPSKDFLDVSVTCQFSRKQVPLEPVRSYFLFSSRHVAAQKPENTATSVGGRAIHCASPPPLLCAQSCVGACTRGAACAGTKEPMLTIYLCWVMESTKFHHTATTLTKSTCTAEV